MQLLGVGAELFNCSGGFSAATNFLFQAARSSVELSPEYFRLRAAIQPVNGGEAAVLICREFDLICVTFTSDVGASIVISRFKSASSNTFTGASSDRAR